MLNAHEGRQVLGGSFTQNYLSSVSQKPCEVTGEDTEAQRGWPQVALLGRTRGGIQTLIAQHHSFPNGTGPEKTLFMLQLHILPPVRLDPWPKGLKEKLKG